MHQSRVHFGNSFLVILISVNYFPGPEKWLIRNYRLKKGKAFLLFQINPQTVSALLELPGSRTI